MFLFWYHVFLCCVLASSYEYEQKVATVEYIIELTLQCPILAKGILNIAAPLCTDCFCVEFSWYLGMNAASFWKLYNLLKVMYLWQHFLKQFLF
jgi:hypothetical protein